MCQLCDQVREGRAADKIGYTLGGGDNQGRKDRQYYVSTSNRTPKDILSSLQSIAPKRFHRLLLL